MSDTKENPLRILDYAHNRSTHPLRRWIFTAIFIVLWWFFSCIPSAMLVKVYEWLVYPPDPVRMELGVVWLVFWFLIGISGIAFFLWLARKGDIRDAAIPKDQIYHMK